MLQKKMKWNLKKVLFWWCILASSFLLLTVCNYLWPFAGPEQPFERNYIGLAVVIKELLFSFAAYYFIRIGKIRPCIIIIVIWILVKLIYGGTVLFVEVNTISKAGIFVGQIFQSCVLGYFAVVESKYYQAEANAT